MERPVLLKGTRRWPAWVDARLLALALLFAAIAAVGLTVADDGGPQSNRTTPAAIESPVDDVQSVDLIAVLN